VKHVLLLIPWLFLLVGIASIPAYLILRVFLGIDLIHVVAAALTDPQGVSNYLMQTTQSEPTKSLFLFTTFPGFTFAAVFSTVFMIWVERKFVAKIQLRVGPQYAGRYGGILQNFADLFKPLFKEIIIPDKADKRVFVAVLVALMIGLGVFPQVGIGFSQGEVPSIFPH
jgi:NADH-quinone oxidoreductase subunit H